MATETAAGAVDWAKARAIAASDENQQALAWTHRDFAIAVDFMASGQVDVKPLVSDIIPLADIQQKGFERLKSDRSLIKVLVEP